ncbi:MAG: S-layer homology domain-containing protein, partial [Clostridia bacterium]|nr:S-layer homology domain-containing protein [Clostridia bacterium]
FVLRLDENAVLADQFTAVGYDQYGRVMDGVNFEWATSNPEVVSLENGTLTALQEDSTEIYAKSGDVESNHITLTVNATRRLTSITADGVQSTARKNTTLDLSTVVVKTYDQFQKVFTQEELAAYPASIRWTLEKNDTNAVISGNILSFGDQEGTMTLICAAVNADTNVIVEKRIDITITSSGSGGGGGSTGGGGGGGGSMAPSKPVVPEYVNPFTDVKEGDYFFDAVKWAVENGITTGTTETTFSPDMECTRAQAVTFLYRAAGSPAVKGDMPFADIAEDAYYYDAVLWAVNNGITKGVSETEFAPDEVCTREQIVTFLYRTAVSLGKDVSVGEDTNILSYDDAFDIGEWAIPAMQWAVGEGVMTGTSESTLSPKMVCTRAQIVTFLARAFGE